MTSVHGGNVSSMRWEVAVMWTITGTVIRSKAIFSAGPVGRKEMINLVRRVFLS